MWERMEEITRNHSLWTSLFLPKKKKRKSLYNMTVQCTPYCWRRRVVRRDCRLYCRVLLYHFFEPYSHFLWSCKRCIYFYPHAFCKKHLARQLWETSRLQLFDNEPWLDHTLKFITNNSSFLEYFTYIFSVQKLGAWRQVLLNGTNRTSDKNRVVSQKKSKAGLTIMKFWMFPGKSRKESCGLVK